ncbi:MAG: hypothetical protein J1E57_11655 [Prevotella sp.]|nr:hypothetical protein [Prevotella sp.]
MGYTRGIEHEVSREREPGVNTMAGYEHKRFSNDIRYTRLMQTALYLSV